MHKSDFISLIMASSGVWSNLTCKQTMGTTDDRVIIVVMKWQLCPEAGLLQILMKIENDGFCRWRKHFDKITDSLKIQDAQNCA